ncbi:hypothetical protein M378DRAFT_154995 [Amanita muscaria Koide BX008]|uniref:Uncharacterized protein n=1 Tax=Amanita muscaria (strain Koide BX008) TaxID=946122 RepID=A0A0C2T618_AMAMK|nr:hypothetical protein M378DRAFT_154995 [Amanita muscaria Koide BX008]
MPVQNLEAKRQVVARKPDIDPNQTGKEEVNSKTERPEPSKGIEPEYQRRIRQGNDPSVTSVQGALLEPNEGHSYYLCGMSR